MCTLTYVTRPFGPVTYIPYFFLLSPADKRVLCRLSAAYGRSLPQFSLLEYLLLSILPFSHRTILPPDNMTTRIENEKSGDDQVEHIGKHDDLANLSRSENDIDRKAERKLLLKLDLAILPMTVLMASHFVENMSPTGS